MATSTGDCPSSMDAMFIHRLLPKAMERIGRSNPDMIVRHWAVAMLKKRVYYRIAKC